MRRAVLPVRPGFKRTRALGAALTLAAASMAASAADTLKPFPPAPPGQVRYVIDLEPMPDEARHQVELLIGKEMTVDCNRRHLGGELRRETINGWGYSYYTVNDIRGPAGTLMACPPGESRQDFVSLGGGPHWTRYNSRLPLVVYVPDGFEVRYRLWSADAGSTQAQRK